ncbi:hypothetical protein F5B22DRAFT_69057 [Xylaria bambusicola]|uniref:uncharacterized protein n=1 Tax=Xylaria bambusicola TaxID=326684 RepID=UPI00200737B4|nr:uncharacterized protein F5B22DRAFT_69057 [Xylaria bambusicola]KAI0518525.1 hypothetical protein F5B22DRAFT_69057 [Xylaria bambusicola]
MVSKTPSKLDPSNARSYEINGGTFDANWCGHREDNYPEDSPEYHTWQAMLQEHGVRQVGLENDVHHTPTATYNLYYPALSVSQDIVPSSHEPSISTMEPNVAKDHDEETQAQEDPIALLIKAEEENISWLKSMVDKERKEYEALRAKLFEMFIIVTQNQERELVELRKRICGLQGNGGNVSLNQEWQQLQRNFHDLQHKVDEHTRYKIFQEQSSGGQTGKFAAIMTSLREECLNITDGLVALGQKIHEAKLRDGVRKPHGDDKHTITGMTGLRLLDTLDISVRFDLPPPCSSAEGILDTYNEYSQLQRDRIATRKNKVQQLLRDTGRELFSFQRDMEDEERWTTRMIERLLFPGGDTEVPEVVCPMLSKVSKLKQATLNRGAHRFKEIAEIVLEMESHLDNIGLRNLDLTLRPTNPNFSATRANQTSTTARADITGEGTVASYTAGLKSKLKGKQVDEKAQATRLEIINEQLSDENITATWCPSR